MSVVSTADWCWHYEPAHCKQMFAFAISSYAFFLLLVGRMEVFTNQDQNVQSAVKIIIKRHVFTCDINNTTSCCSSPSAQEKEWTQKQLYVQRLCDRRSQFVAIGAQQFRLRVQRMRWLEIHIEKHDEKTQCLRSTPSWECCQTSVWNRQRLISNTQRGPTSPPLIYSSGATVPVPRVDGWLFLPVTSLSPSLIIPYLQLHPSNIWHSPAS